MEYFEVSKGEKAKLLENELSKEISELQNEIEECEMTFGNFTRPKRYGFNILSIQHEFCTVNLLFTML